jgi:hypothetical protein
VQNLSTCYPTTKANDGEVCHFIEQNEYFAIPPGHHSTEERFW